MIYLILIILTLSTLLYICGPLTSSEPPKYVGESKEVYRDVINATPAETSAGLSRQLLKRVENKPLVTAVPRAWLATVFVGSLILTAGLYHHFGRADLTQGPLPKAQPQTVAPPPAFDRESIAQMSPQGRAKMIEAMVASLAARLRDDPEDIEGWVRLLRSRQVLGQDMTDDLALMRETFEDAPEIVEDILSRSAVKPTP
jgi:cytochrome c-type biogenesis protein CcmH/NrfG